MTSIVLLTMMVTFSWPPWPSRFVRVIVLGLRTSVTLHAELAAADPGDSHGVPLALQLPDGARRAGVGHPAKAALFIGQATYCRAVAGCRRIAELIAWASGARFGSHSTRWRSRQYQSRCDRYSGRGECCDGELPH